MCGICGVLRLDGEGPGDGPLVAGMMEALEHRGPDGGGAWADGPVVLGHRRLAIIDLEGGHQPLLNETGTVAVVFNGEIYNFRELRRELSAHGHRFRTTSDTEVLVHGYEQWGDDLLPRLRGMFAFALWDGTRRRLVLVRDRLGVKPLYYTLDAAGGRLAFASEVKALFADPAQTRALDEVALAEYLAFRSVVGRGTLFRGVRELEPGTVLVVEERQPPRVRRFWSPPHPDDAAPSGDLLVEQGRSFLVDAVRARLVSDVPLGTITSGGLDSSLVSAIAAELAGSAIDTFCVGFEDPAYDERPFARAVAERIRSRHHEIEVVPGELDRELDRLTWAHDEPLSHPNSVPMHLVFRAAKEEAGVTVLLSGEGADEVFGGYDWYAVAHRRERLRRVPGLAALAGALPVGRLATLARVLDPGYLRFASAVTHPAALDRLIPGTADRLRGVRPWRSPEGVDGLFHRDQTTYLLPLLQRQDRMSMAAGVEARVPFLDHHLVEWANRLRAGAKLPRGERKALLKAIAGRWLGDDIVHRRKVGFTMPLGAWMRRGGPLADRVRALGEPTAPLASLISLRRVRQVVDEHSAGSVDHTGLLWTLLALDTWHRVFLEGSVRGERLPGAATGRRAEEVRVAAS